MTLRAQTAGRQFVLKLPTDRMAGLPANEHVTMHIAALCGLPVSEQQHACTRLLNERALVLAELARRS